MEIKRIFDLIPYVNTNFQKDIFLAGKVNKEWVTYSIKDYEEITEYFSLGIMKMGIKRGEKVAMIANNRPEWNFIDMGLMQAGVVHVPIYPTISVEDYEYILNHCEPKLIIVSDEQLYKKLISIVEKTPSVKDMYTINDIEGIKNWKEIIDLGKKHKESLYNEYISQKESIQENDLATLIYTSGTTGFPKGVMLSHKNIVSNFTVFGDAHNCNEHNRVLSFLPMCHVYERTVNYHFQHKGMTIYYAESMATIVDDIKDVKPTIFNSVPRLLERVYDKIISKGKDLKGISSKIFFWAVNLGLRYEHNRINGWFYHFKLKIADALVFKKWREALGGEVNIIVSGGAALQPRLGRVFTAAGITILEGYGLTESSPVIAVNNMVSGEMKFGTVGPIIRNIDVRIAEDGEIMVNGPNVMMGYYKDDAQTKEVIDSDGWLHTGDIGVLDKGKFLKITDRKKEIFKLSSGKYIAPQPIENKLKESIFIEQAMVVGENEKFASALVSPNITYLHNWSSQRHINFHTNQDLIEHPEIVQLYQKEVERINKGLGEYEKIKRIRVLVDEWSPQTGEMSPTLKLKRQLIRQKYKDIIQDIYKVQRKEELQEQGA